MLIGFTQNEGRPHAECAEWKGDLTQNSQNGKEFFETRMFMNEHELIQKFLTTD